MKFKFGQPVKIIKKNFYYGAVGVIIRFDIVDNVYDILLPYNTITHAYENELVKSRKNPLRSPK